MDIPEIDHAQPEQRQRSPGHPGRTLKTIPLLVAALSVFIGGVVLVGWAFDIPALRSILPGWAPMKANSALGFILAGAALLSSSLPSSTLSARLARLCTLLCGLIGLLTLGEYLFAWNLGFDQWLFAEPAYPVGTSHPGRMAPDTAACFVLLAAGLTLACGARKTTMRFWFTTILGSLTMAVALAAFMSYCTMTIGAFGIWGLALMSFPTATLFVLLSMAIVLSAWPEDISLWSLPGKTALGFALWSVIMSLSLTWGLHQQGHHLLESATVTARVNINKDLSFRRWASSHGGVYVPPTEHTPPNPYLKVPHRDVITTTGKPLTLMNPAYMLREMQHDFGDEYGTKSHLTSLNLLNPANAPDAWQVKALSSFARGGKELLEMQYMDDQPYLRLMRPIMVEAGCLKCHAQQGYKLGDVRGGIDTSIPLAPFLARTRTSSIELTLSHGAIWLLGISGLLLFYRREHYLDAENQRSALALRESEQSLKKAQSIAHIGNWELDLTSNKLRWSDEIYRIFEIDPKNFAASYEAFLETIHPDDQEAVNRTYTESLISKTPYEIVHRLLMKDGRVKHVHERGETFYDSEGRPRRSVGTVQDITERKLAEEEKQKLESQLRQAQKIEAIGTLAGGIAHDFNNILSIIFGYNELAMEEKDPINRQHHLEELKKGAERAKQLVAQILAFSRKAEQQQQPLQISLIIKEALKMLRASIPTTIEIRQNIVSTGLVMADPTQIHQVIMNLCTNAYHAMRETGGTIAVSLEEIQIGAEDYGYADLTPGNYLKLEVSDTGCGIDPKIQEKIFEPYFTTKKPGEGTGLGLAVVHGIVKSHHGHITVYSELGKGTSFHVYLPLLTEQVAVALPDKTAPQELLGKGERVLVVDDEVQIREVVDAILSNNGYQVAAFAEAKKALAEFQKNPEQFDLVVTDMTMPSMTGVELAQKILALRPRTPVILCTGQSELINREKALAMGICDYLNKPVLTETLLVAVKKALGKK